MHTGRRKCGQETLTFVDLAFARWDEYDIHTHD